MYYTCFVGNTTIDMVLYLPSIYMRVSTFTEWVRSMETEKIKILIVDDSPLIVKRLTATLKDLECTGSVTHAASYTQAIKIVEEALPRLVLLDIQLPGKSGIEVLRYIREKQLPITVIMLTNQSDDYYRQLCEQIGADHFIDKSTGFEQIPAIIGSIES